MRDSITFHFYEAIKNKFGAAPLSFSGYGELQRFRAKGDTRDNCVCRLNSDGTGWAHSFRTGQRLSFGQAALFTSGDIPLAGSSENAKNERTAQFARQLLSTADSASDEHPYLVCKRVPAFDLLQMGRVLLIPLRDIDGRVWNFQWIDEEGNKQFRSGRKRGCMHFLNLPETTPPERLYIAEGFATAASVACITDKPAVIAFDAGNLVPVAVAVNERWPDAKIVIAADCDKAGLKYARKAAALVGGEVTYPPVLGQDWNDAWVTALAESENSRGT